MAEQRRMLDTNTASHVIKGRVVALSMLKSYSAQSLCVSAITKAELLYGVTRRPESKQLKKLVTAFLDRLDVLPWDAGVATTYGAVRAGCNTRGVFLGSMDMLIAAHAISIGAVLVSDDRAFKQIGEPLQLESWC